jgi:hypothetical protein
MKITIDEKVCLKHKMTVPEVLTALAIRSSEHTDDLLENMENREIIVYVEKDNNYLVTQHWSEVLDEILCDSSEECVKSDIELLELAKKMREVYPLGKMKDRFGRETPYYYRCNNSEIVKKLKKFFTLFGNYSDEEIVDATKRYVASCRGDYNGKLRLIKYFILKDAVKETEDGNHVEQISDLLTFLENRESEEEVGVNTNDNWLSNSRN